MRNRLNKHTLWILLLFCCCSSAFSQNVIGGIGAQLFIDTAGGHTMPRIQGLVPGTPAYDSLRATDFIISVNGNNCRDKNLETIVGWIRGVAGTAVQMIVADTKEGGRPRTYNLKRVAMQMPDPLTPFYEWGNSQAAQLKKSGFEIVSTFTSECGNYFFNFNAEAGGYRVRLYALEDKGSNAATAKVYDANNEASAIRLTHSPDPANPQTSQQDGSITLKKDCIATISTEVNGDAKKCAAMYIIVYR